MNSEIERLGRDLAGDPRFSQELTAFTGTFEELIGWLNGRGYALDAGELAEVLSRQGDELSADELDRVAGGMGQEQSPTPGFISTLSNIMKKISTTQDTLTQNVK